MRTTSQQTRYSTSKTGAADIEQDIIKTIDNAFDFILGMTYRHGQIRQFVLGVIIIGIWIGLTFINNPWLEWRRDIGAILWGTGLEPGVNPFINLVTQITSRFLAPAVLSRMIVLIAPFLVVLKLAAVYLADIFELESPFIAERFITQAAFSYPESFERIQIRSTEVPREDVNSPIYRIGGPGLVEVFLENVAVFERIQKPGTGNAKTSDDFLDIIDPSQSPKRIEGFERLREVFDLRDQFCRIDISGRTKDGIRLSVHDMRVLFSVLRDGGVTNPSVTNYTFQRESIRRLVCLEPRPGGENIPLHNIMAKLIERELVQYIQDHTLREILATSVDSGKKAAGDNSSGNGIQKDGYLAERAVETETTLIFSPRADLSNALFDPNGSFQMNCREHGIRVEWADIGIWEASGDIVPKQHTEAWKITRENYQKSSEFSLKGLWFQERKKQLGQLTLGILNRFFTLAQRENANREQIIRDLLDQYLVLLRMSLDLDQPAQADPAGKVLSRADVDRIKRLTGFEGASRRFEQARPQIENAIAWIERFFSEQAVRPVPSPITSSTSPNQGRAAGAQTSSGAGEKPSADGSLSPGMTQPSSASRPAVPQPNKPSIIDQSPPAKPGSPQFSPKTSGNSIPPLKPDLNAPQSKPGEPAPKNTAPAPLSTPRPSEPASRQPLKPKDEPHRFRTNPPPRISPGAPQGGSNLTKPRPLLPPLPENEDDEPDEPQYIPVDDQPPEE